MEYINPIDSIKINEHILIAKECWPEHFGREIEDINIIKQFYNDSYNLFHEKILTTLNKYHPATWIRIAYIQLEIWTLNFYKARHEDKNFQEVPFLFIPIARYGWRYIIEISLEINQHENNNQDSKIPVQEDINLIFTYLIGLSYCNELSNYLHYFKKHFHNTKLIFNSNIFTKFPELTNETEQFINKIFNYIDVKEIEEEFNYFNNNYILNQIDDFLENQFQFNLKDIDKVIDCLRDDISVSINASNLIIAYPELILLLSEKTRLNISKVKNIVDFIYLDTIKYNYEKRDFLKRSQVVRMLNFAGCIFDLEKEKLKTVYSDESASWKHIYKHKNHTIISFIILEEWKMNFISRFIYGQRSDLKELNSTLNDEIARIEHNFNRNFFEKILIKMFNDLKIPCKSVDEINRIKISCGEIDGIAIDNKNKIIYIIEAKNLAPTKDARAFGRLISDHYKQKKYHNKFLNKISWVKENIENLLNHFKMDIDENYKIESYFVTANPSIIKFIEKEYPILTYSEFKKLIYERYKS